eukprot:3296194-Pyramimonas_sp.AAC.1
MGLQEGPRDPVGLAAGTEGHEDLQCHHHQPRSPARGQHSWTRTCSSAPGTIVSAHRARCEPQC